LLNPGSGSILNVCGYVTLALTDPSVPDPKLIILDPDPDPQIENHEFRIWIRIRIRILILDPDPSVT